MNRVLAFIDGFNLYHAIDKYDRGATPADQARYQRYKWLCLKSLIKTFIRPNDEVLEGIEYFTSYPTWNEPKRLRHRTYVSAQIYMGVHVVFGEFKEKTIKCRAVAVVSKNSRETKKSKRMSI